MVIQIDTDLSHQKPFNVSHTKPDNTSKTDDELHFDVIEKIKRLIDPEITATYADRIFFAICIHTIECWLLPLYYNDHHKTATTKCLRPLNEQLRRKNIHVIAEKQKNNPNSVRTYEIILKNWKRKQDIIDSAQHNTGFKKLLESFKAIDKLSS